MLRGLHHAGEIDPRDHRETAHHRSLAGEREPVLVVEARPFDADGDVAVHQVLLVEIGETDRLPVVGLVNEDRPERRHRTVPVMAGLVPAIPISVARFCPLNRDHRDNPRRLRRLAR
jgi:hypothetical protein